MINKKRIISISILSVSIFTIVLSLSYAFFVRNTSNAASTPGDVTTGLGSEHRFIKGDPINLVADLDNFAVNDGSLSGETISSSELRALEGATSTANYNIYFEINSNNFIYTQNEDTPELLLTVTAPDGSLITTIDGLEYKTVTTKVKDPNDTDGTDGWDTITKEVSGFDITNKKDFYVIDEDYVHTTNSLTYDSQDWKAEITFINLDDYQGRNEGRKLEANLILMTNKPFDKFILLNNGGKNYIESRPTPDFSQIADTNEGMFAAPDNYGTSYYFRGAVDNNWVNFAGFYWRIVRINGDGSVRIIYSGETAPLENQKVVMTGLGTVTVGLSYPNEGNYVTLGYTYSTDNIRGSEIDSVYKSSVDDWYMNNLMSYTKYINDTIFCNERTHHNPNEFIGYKNIYSSTPSYFCSTILDRYTVNDVIKGNGILTYPVGLISSDELLYSGAILYTSNIYNFLYTNINYFTMTPITTNNYGQFIAQMETNGSIENYHLYHVPFAYIRPVINLKQSQNFTGTGAWDDPYEIITN